MHKKNGKERGLESLTDQKYYLVDVMLLSLDTYSTVDFCIDSFISSSPEKDSFRIFIRINTFGLIFVRVDFVRN